MKKDFNFEQELEELKAKHQKEIRALELTNKVYSLCGVKPLAHTHYERDCVGFDFKNEFNLTGRHTLQKVFSFLLENFPLDKKAKSYENTFASKESIQCDGAWKIDIEKYSNTLRYENKDFIILVKLPEEFSEKYVVMYNNHKKNPDVFMQPILPKDLVEKFTTKTTIYGTGISHEKRFVYSGTNEQLIQLMEYYANS